MLAISPSEAAGSVVVTSKATDGGSSTRARTSRIGRVTAEHADTRAEFRSSERDHVLTVWNQPSRT